MTTTIEQLNRRLGERLGTVRSGTMPRFKWGLATDDDYWGQKLGPVWVLCQWQENAYTRQQWESIHQGSRKYQAAFHQVQGETALAPGRLPDERTTHYYIDAISQQLEATYEDQLAKVEAEIEIDKEKDYAVWVAMVQDCNYSAYDNREVVGYGTRHSAGLPV